jgi:tryptophan 2,3-dioxygenase
MSYFSGLLFGLFTAGQTAMRTKSDEYKNPAHDEMLFIIVHQVYELWFKQIMHELDSVIKMFREETIDEKNIGVAVSRILRITEIQKLLIEQLRVLETMTPLDFLDFRDYLFPHRVSERPVQAD